MVDKFTAPTTCRICGGTMEAGTLKTSREGYRVPDNYPFAQLTYGELWYRLEVPNDGQLMMKIPEDGPFMVLHYRCADCGYLESYARGKYPS